MKDYKITKIWASEISEISEIIDREINRQKEWLQNRKNDLANKEPDSQSDWELEQIEELEEKIKVLEWCINQINAPFKFKK